MLGKVMKHEWLDTGKIMLPLTLSQLGCGLLGIIVLNLVNFDKAYGSLISVGVFILYVMACFALEVTATVYLCVRFYKSMFGSESYLTHTLPVSNMALYHGKLLVAAAWQLFNIVLVYGTAFGMGFALGKNVAESAGEPEFMNEVVQGVIEFMGLDSPLFVIGMVAFFVLTAFSGMISIYACMAVGQLFEKHKVLASVVGYVVLLLVEQVISTVSMMVVNVYQGEIHIDKELAAGTFTFSNIYGPTMIVSLIESLVFTLICYVVGLYICNKKLNIE